ncbi:helix-turn-helix domain-containing protein [Chryseobacterium sp. JAH]|uniref:helix-turn-helix domain-containing protein n=1 Tax=Chryseobacterium sp. JAH TaxID=1742858 RepID=UPI000A7A8ED3|nr:helix-turn-helix transcriptional regulator [Chryseobacterium sp. JAH]
MRTKDEELVRFGIHIKNLRKSKGVSQDDVVANSNNLTKSTVSDVENGKRNFAFTTFLDLARGLSVSPTELIKYFNLDKN